MFPTYSLYATDPEGCVCECEALLNERNLDTAVRTGDVYGLLIEHFAQARDYRKVCMYGVRTHFVDRLLAP